MRKLIKMKSNQIVFFRFFILSMLLVAGLMANAQPDPWGPDTTQSPPELESYDHLLEYVYGDLTEHLNSSILIDRAGTASDKSVFTGKTPDAAASKYDYYLTYTEMAESQIPRGTPMTFLEMDSAAKSIYFIDDVVTISIMSCDYSAISPQAKELDGVYWDGYQLRVLDHDVSYDLFDEESLFGLMPLIEAVTLDGYVKFKISEEYFFLLGEDYNSEQELNIALEINFDDGMGYREVEIGQEFEIYYDQMGEKVWNYRALVNEEHFHYGLSEFSLRGGDPEITYNCGEGTLILNDASFRDEPQVIMSLSTDAVIENSANKDPDKVNGKMGIYFGCGNTDCTIKRPFIFVTGFGPDPFVSPKKELISDEAAGMFYHHFNGVYGQQADKDAGQDGSDNNGTNLLYRLRNEGYDIIILDFENGVDYVQNHAALIEQAIKNVNFIMKAKGNKHETLILGQSMGGVSTRYALADWERKYMQEDSEPYMHHHCRSWFSWEGEMQGATIPLGLQLSTWYLTTRLPMGLAASFFGPGAGLASMGIAKLLHFSVLNEALNNPAAKSLLTYHFSNNKANGDPVTNKHPYHLQVQSELSVLGYPQQVRRIAVANGPSRLIRPKDIHLGGGDCLLDLHYGGISPGIPFSWGRMMMKTEKVGQNQEVFRGRYRVLGIKVPGMNKTIEKNYAKAESIAPGSFERFYNGIFYKMTPFTIGGWTGSCALANYRVPFVPTTTVFDIQDDNTNNYAYDMVDNNLFWINSSNDGLNFSMGYPHIMNVQYKTPFHVLYASPMPEFHNQNPQKGLRDFILLESSKQYGDLQNRRIEGRQGSVYSASFEAREEIFAGKDVTIATASGEFEIGEFTDVDIIAPKVTLRSGFHAETGARVMIKSAESAPDPCFSFGTNGQKMVEASQANEIVNNSDQFVATLKVMASPNPTRGEIELLVEGHQGYSVDVFDFSGQLIHTGNTIDEKFIYNLSSYQSGQFILRVTTQDEVGYAKILKL
jgi:hypothetical protein